MSTLARASKVVSGVSMRVSRIHAPCAEHIEFEVCTDEFPSSYAGQFVQIRCADETDESAATHEWAEGARWPVLTSPGDFERTPFLRRPFSIADRRDEEGRTHLRFLSRTIGVGTEWLARRSVGDTINITGPLGTPFAIPERPRPVVLIGGGVGIPPMLYLARELHARGFPEVTLVLGVMRADLLPVRVLQPPTDDGMPKHCIELPGGATYASIVTSDDGSIGLCGRVTDGLDRWRASRAAAEQEPLVLACGPEPMLKALAAQTRAFGYACQLCIEKLMGCGLATCLSCVVRVFDETRVEGWRWALSCTEGPVFDRDRLVDYSDV